MKAIAGFTREANLKLPREVFVIGFALILLGTPALQPSAFSQETVQQGITRKVKTKVDPRYPAPARQYQLKGTVKIEVTVSPDGSVIRARLVGGNALFAGAALDAARQWKYESAQKETVELANFVFDYNAE